MTRLDDEYPFRPFLFNLYKRPSDMIVEVERRFEAGGKGAADDYIRSLSGEDHEKLAREIIELALELPLLAMALREVNFSAS